MPTPGARGPFLTTMAVLLGLLAVSNATKALQYALNPGMSGIVVFGVRQETIAGNLVLGPLMAAVLAAYAVGLWRQRAWVRPIAYAYAFYVPTNLVLFWYRAPSDPVPPVAFLLGYLVFALGGSIGTALVLAARGR
jgi:hypothetical protein